MKYDDIQYFYFAGEFFIDIDLPVTLKYKGSAGCAPPVMNEDALRDKLEAAVNTLQPCRQKCSPHDVMLECSGTGTNTEITAKFDVTIFNPHPNEIPLNCSISCKYESMGNMVRTAMMVSNGIQTIVERNQALLELSGAGAPSIDVTGTLAVPKERPQLLCQPGYVLTKTRLCGKYLIYSLLAIKSLSSLNYQ